MALTGKKLWASKNRTLTAKADIGVILSSAVRLPVRYWRRGMLFHGAADELLFGLSAGVFPGRLVKRKRRPVYALGSLPDDAGFRICPCSTKSPRRSKRITYIRKGCRLVHTDYTTDRRSYLVKDIWLNLPADIAGRLRFRGQVPDECLIEETRCDRNNGTEHG